MLKISDIKKSFGKKRILNGISVCAEEGDCVGIFGVNGSGKSTFFNVLAGISSCDAGSFTFGDVSLFSDKSYRSNVLGYVTQSPPLIDELCAYDNLLLWYDRKSLKRELEDGVLKMLGIDAFLKVRVSKMSGGMKKRLAIGCAVAHKPKILLLDEPSAALDLVCKERIAQYLADFKNNGGIILIATHDVQDIPLCDKMYIFKDGYANEYDFDGNVQNLISSL